MKPVYPDDHYVGQVRPSGFRRYGSSEPAAPRVDWRDRASCRNSETSIFYPDLMQYREYGLTVEHRNHPAWREALAICEFCPVVDDCLKYGLSSPAERKHGVLGGTIPPERMKMPAMPVCGECGEQFVVRKRLGNERYCGAECRRVAHNRQEAEAKRRSA